ncbi:MAG: response regulator [Deltaproteobacteria bacterium]|nr:response regulator [Deltaproteobacteria bacterium]NNK84028.1 response regulator [Desulfobacterales bacterium]
MKILIVEDDPVSQKLLEKIVRREGYDSVQVNDGKTAWEKIKKEKFDMVITDWMMPEMDGLQLCRKIRQANLSKYVYVILLTSKDQTEDAVAALDAGADDYIKKPFNPDELKARILAGNRIIELEDNQKKANAQLLQSEKMASIGQLAAGVAHEINNPTGFVSSNLKTLTDYLNDLNNLINHYRKLVADLQDTQPENLSSSIEKQLKQIASLEDEADIDFILEDIMDLISDCKEGAVRIKKIVLDLKDFAHPGEDKIQSSDINDGIETTLSVVWNELKYKATVNKELGKLPMVKCYPQQLNQVFMNLFVNGAQAIEKKGEINISTHADNGFVEIKIGDTGSGIDQKNLDRIFDPFFTTKDVGKGTGLGLNVAYNIIKKHRGTIEVKSQLGKGTVFKIRIPVEGLND